MGIKCEQYGYAVIIDNTISDENSTLTSRTLISGNYSTGQDIILLIVIWQLWKYKDA